MSNDLVNGHALDLQRNGLDQATRNAGCVGKVVCGETVGVRKQRLYFALVGEAKRQAFHTVRQLVEFNIAFQRGKGLWFWLKRQDPDIGRQSGGINSKTTDVGATVEHHGAVRNRPVGKTVQIMVFNVNLSKIVQHNLIGTWKTFGNLQNKPLALKAKRPAGFVHGPPDQSPALRHLA